jgi:hypothetical protein
MKKNCKKCKQKPIKNTLGYVVGKDVFIQTPPITPTFYLPPEEEINKLKVGNEVKLIFVDGENAERMWVIITKQLESTPVEWVGKLDNHPVFLNAKAGDVVRFSSKAIINIYESEEIE